jgi:hypothetical protein
MGWAVVYTVDMQYNLPKGYLSHSAMTLWRQSKDNYRKKYYSKIDEFNFSTAYTEFGKMIAETLEVPKLRKAHPVLSKIPCYKESEYKLEFEVDGVPVKGFIDSFDPKKKRVLEYKTGIRKDGKPAWTDVMVKKQNQTLLYSLGVEILLGEVHPTSTLVWMETCWKEECWQTPFGNTMLEECGPRLALTGHFEVFKRKIEPWELLWMRQEVVKIASEISEDYTRYQQLSN